MKKTILFVLLVLAGASLSYAQQRVTGRVTFKDDGQPIAFATVIVKGTTVSTSTNGDGEYAINVPDGATTLTVSLIGMISQDITIAGRGVIDVVLESEAEVLDGTVVTAMGIRKERKALGYAVQEIKAEELMKHKDANVINSLNGKIAGVNVTNTGGAPGSSASIIIRGGTSLERDNQPLFVVDGIPIDNSTGQGDNSAFDGSTNSSTTNGNRAMDINPEDIESISILKGPAAAALYGLRAAAGAVVITTKKGEEGQISVNYNTRFSVNWVGKLPEQQTKYKQGYYYDGKVMGSNPFTETIYSWGEAYGANDKIYNNVEDFFETAVAWENNVSVSGGTKTGNFFLSANHLDQGGVVPTTDFARSSVRFNGEQKLGIFTFGINASYTQSETTKTLTGTGLWGASGSGVIENLFLWPRNQNMSEWLDANGDKTRLLPNAELINDSENPYWAVNRMPQSNSTNRLIGSVYTNVKVTDWFDINYRLGYDMYTNRDENLVQPGSAVKVAWQNGMYSVRNMDYEYVNSNLMLNFHKTFGDWDFGLLMGHNTDNYNVESSNTRAEGFLVPGLISINNSNQSNQYVFYSHNNRRLVGTFGDFRVSYKSIAYLGITGRNDWTSTLVKDYRSFFYPAVSGSFVFSELLPKNNVLSFAKLRASWAEVGKDAPAYQTYTYMFGPELTIGGGYRNHWTQGNPVLKPETTTSTEVGLEARFLNGRIGLDMAVYENKSVDQILNPRVDNATGFILKFVNTGVIRNRGIEATVTATPVKKNNFVWDMMFNVSHNKGKVESLPGDIPILYVTDVQVGNAKAASYNNGKFMALSGQEWSTDANGNLILDWNTGYPIPDNLTTKYVGNREPKFIGGLTNNLSYKNLTLSFLLDFRVGGDIYNGTRYLMTVYGISEETANRGETKTFTGVALNPTTKQYEEVSRDVKLDEQYYRQVHLLHTPNFIEEVNWLRLRSVSLAYNLPNSLLNKIGFIKGASVVLTGTNLFMITNYSGMDPETSAAGAGVVGSGSVGVDYCGVPSTRGFSMGLNLKF